MRGDLPQCPRTRKRVTTHSGHRAHTHAYTVRTTLPHAVTHVRSVNASQEPLGRGGNPCLMTILYGTFAREFSCKNRKVSKIPGSHVFFVSKSIEKNRETGRMDALRSLQALRTFLDLSDLLKVELKNDNVQLFDSRLNEAIIARRKHPDDEFLNFIQRSLRKRVRSSSCLLCTCKTPFKKGEDRRYTPLERMVNGHLQQKTRE